MKNIELININEIEIKIIEKVALNKLNYPISTFDVNINIPKYKTEHTYTSSYRHPDLFQDENLFYKCEDAFKDTKRIIRKKYRTKIDLDIDTIIDNYDDSDNKEEFITFLWKNILKKNDNIHYIKEEDIFISKSKLDGLIKDIDNLLDLSKITPEASQFLKLKIKKLS